MKVTDFLRIIAIATVLSIQASEGLIRKCFSCRSRGDRGDCKDPFRVNQTLVIEDQEYQRQVGIKAIPCASGWCGKILEGGGDKD
ncbi:unnamed protein product, partial [Notodromas monacha]